MPNDPRLAIAREYLGLEHRYAELMLAEIDAVDPMRREPGGEAVRMARAKYREVMQGPMDSRWETADRKLERAIREAITAALAVMAGESGAIELKVPDPPPEWTAANDKLHAAMNALLKLAACDDAMPNRKDACYVEAGRAIEVAFPIANPEPVWPPKDCKLADLRTDHRSPCVVVCEFSLCPHAGERADG